MFCMPVLALLLSQKNPFPFLEASIDKGIFMSMPNIRFTSRCFSGFCLMVAARCCSSLWSMSVRSFCAFPLGCPSLS